jgi:hypothetical protein
VSKPSYWKELRDKEIERVSQQILSYSLRRGYVEIEINPKQIRQRHTIRLSLGKASEHGSFRGIMELGYDYRKDMELMSETRSKVVKRVEELLDIEEAEYMERMREKTSEGEEIPKYDRIKIYMN